MSSMSGNSRPVENTVTVPALGDLDGEIEWEARNRLAMFRTRPGNLDRGDGFGTPQTDCRRKRIAAEARSAADNAAKRASAARTR